MGVDCSWHSNTTLYIVYRMTILRFSFPWAVLLQLCGYGSGFVWTTYHLIESGMPGLHCEAHPGSMPDSTLACAMMCLTAAPNCDGFHIPNTTLFDCEMCIRSLADLPQEVGYNGELFLVEHEYLGECTVIPELIQNVCM